MIKRYGDGGSLDQTIYRPRATAPLPVHPAVTHRIFHGPMDHTQPHAASHAHVLRRLPILVDIWNMSVCLAVVTTPFVTVATSHTVTPGKINNGRPTIAGR